ncbi:hypothetical protein [Azospirillum canadense]|uniref:hypothetical protein n=1 Tax=Azospirillum canadense TaxID=403962 RepID=UPI002226FF75|nr:hypothetical protein [Azospirillum canadense]MCW2238954.1 hypothetical protein [Azospirillum canadense]
MTAIVTSLPPRSPLPFDPGMPAADRCAMLAAALPAPLQEILAHGRVARRTRFTDDGFDGVTEDWTPPATVTEQHVRMARRALDELAATVLTPVSPEHLLARILALLSHYPAKGMTPEVEQLVALDWAEDLGEFPSWAVDTAARTWRRTRKWRPSIAEMRALCAESCAEERALATRLAAIASSAPEPGGNHRSTRVQSLAAGAIRRMR